MAPGPGSVPAPAATPDPAFPAALLDRLAGFLPDDDLDLLRASAGPGGPAPLELVQAVPSRTLAVSVTGPACELRCAHCDGHYLGGMKPLDAVGPADLAGRSSLLVSGGCLATGEVPLGARLEVLQRLPADLPLNLHVGLQDGHLLEPLRGRPITVSFDLVGDDETAREVFGLERPAAAWFEAYEALGRRFPVIPHLTIGLRGGRLSGEGKVVDYLADNPPAALTFLVFRPTPGTVYAGRTPPSLAEIVACIRSAAGRLGCPIHLGCMRPAGPFRRRLDILAWAAGARTIVMPDRALVGALSAAGVPIRETRDCCSLSPGLSHATS